MINFREMALSWVPRWAIVNTIQKQSVADHCFGVALLVDRIATVVGVPEDNYKLRHKLQRAALVHDAFESISGDLPTPYKRVISDSQAYEKYKHKFQETYELDEFQKRILKIADLMEAAIFLNREQFLGNMSVTLIQNEIINKLRTACFEAGPEVWIAVDGALQSIPTHQDPL